MNHTSAWYVSYNFFFYFNFIIVYLLFELLLLYELYNLVLLYMYLTLYFCMGYGMYYFSNTVIGIINFFYLLLWYGLYNLDFFILLKQHILRPHLQLFIISPRIQSIITYTYLRCAPTVRF